MAELPDSLSATETYCIEALLEAKPFDEINGTQRAFFEQGGLEESNTLLVAETGNGKTFCAEAVVKRALERGQTVGYLVPSVQLTNGKYSSLNKWIDTDRYTLTNATWGDEAGYQYADVIVATFDSHFEAAIRGVDSRVDVLVYDDFHELYSGFRGPTIEKSLAMAMDRDVEICAMSATIGNPDEIARWLDAELIISPEDRGVPIVERPLEKSGNKTYGEFIADHMTKRVDEAPFMIFNFTTDHTRSRAVQIASHSDFKRPETDYREKIENAIDTTLTDTHQDLIKCLEQGVGFHYSALENDIKQIVEKGVKNSEIQAISCTTTLAYGFDSPVQAVIVADLTRFGNFVGRWEYIQWIGRAGRDSKMEEAYAYPIYSREDAADVFQFDTPVEEKSLESVGSHFGHPKGLDSDADYTTNLESAKTNLEWLLIELVQNGWDSVDALVEFVSSTLYGHYALRDRLPLGENPMIGGEAQGGRGEIADRVRDVLTELVENGFIEMASESMLATTDLGAAAFEYDHATRIDCPPVAIKSLVETLEATAPANPETIVAELAEMFYQCNLGETVTDNESPEFLELLERHDLGTDEAGVTAGVMCWLWAEGIDVELIQLTLDIDVSHVSRTGSQLAEAIRPLAELYTATSHTPPQWLETMARQMDAGVTAEDLHLTSYQGIARGRVIILDDRIRNAWQNFGEGTDTIDLSHPTIKKLAVQYENSVRFEQRLVSNAEGIGSQTAPTVVQAIEDWIGGDTTVPARPPFTASGREFLEAFGSKKQTRTDGSDSTTAIERDQTSIGSEPRPTSLDDF